MDNLIITAALSGGSAIFGALSAALTSAYTAKKTREHELKKDLEKATIELQKSLTEKAHMQYERAHVLMSIIQRECSLTFMTIDWAAKTSVADWDQKYRTLCGQADELRMIASIYHSEISEIVEQSYGQMNIYWGNFRTFLYRIEQGDSVNYQSPGYKEAHVAANEIHSLLVQAKSALRDVALTASPSHVLQ